LTLAHEEGVGGVNGEIIHLLGFVNVPFQPHPPGCAVRLVDLVAEAQVCGGCPALAFYIEGMFGRCLEPFAVNDEFGQDLILR
jgi:hypothetical protein